MLKKSTKNQKNLLKSQEKIKNLKHFVCLFSSALSLVTNGNLTTKKMCFALQQTLYKWKMNEKLKSVRDIKNSNYYIYKEILIEGAGTD